MFQYNYAYIFFIVLLIIYLITHIKDKSLNITNVILLSIVMCLMYSSELLNIVSMGTTKAKSFINYSRHNLFSYIFLIFAIVIIFNNKYLKHGLNYILIFFIFMNILNADDIYSNPMEHYGRWNLYYKLINNPTFFIPINSENNHYWVIAKGSEYINANTPYGHSYLKLNFAELKSKTKELHGIIIIKPYKRINNIIIYNDKEKVYLKELTLNQNLFYQYFLSDSPITSFSDIKLIIGNNEYSINDNICHKILFFGKSLQNEIQNIDTNKNKSLLKKIVNFFY